MNQTAQETEWRGDCVITLDDKTQVLTLDFQDLRAKKFPALRALVPNFEQGGALTWIHVFSSVSYALKEQFYQWFDASYQGPAQSQSFCIEVRLDRSVDELKLLLKQYLEQHAGIVVHVV